MSALEGQLPTRDGLKLFTLTSRPDPQAPKAVVVHTHGHGEHLGRYGHVIAALVAAGYAVYSYDVRGHGKSGGPRGHTPSYDLFLDDLQAVEAKARQEHPQLPMFLYGHSMGGAITLTYTLKRQPAVKGVAVSAPAIRVAYAPPAWKVTLAKVMAGVWPTFTQSTGLQDAVPMSHDKAFLESFPDLNLTHGNMSARLGADFLTTGAYLDTHASEFTLPLLLLHGEADNTIAPAGSKDFYAHAASADKTLKLYPGMYHEVHNETDRAQVLRDLVTWFDARV
jgi:alpha-beta hydrolase superfamily lysophospholipase